MTSSLAIIGDGAGVVDVLTEDGPAPPWPHRPLIEWQVVGQCNYDCSYCIQSRKHRKGAPTPDALERSLAFFASLPALPGGQRWEVKTTGGEPFSWKPFLDVVVPRLMALPHIVMSTLTNLSSPVDELVRFARLTHGRLHVVSASLHLEFTGTASFLERLRALQEEAAPSARFVVNCVLAPDALHDVKRARDAVVAAGFTFFPQLMKVKGGVHAYSREQLALVRDIVGGDLALAASTRSANLAPAYTGKRCWAGARYVVLDKDGDAWACRTAKRFGEGHLGSVHAVDVAAVGGGGVTLRDGPIRCPYTICPCTTPANRGMIEGVGPAAPEALLADGDA